MTYGSFVSYFALDATKSSVSEGHLCWVLFSKEFLGSEVPQSTPTQGFRTWALPTTPFECSCLHSLGGAYSASGNETNHMAFLWRRHICGLFCCHRSLVPPAPYVCMQAFWRALFRIFWWIWSITHAHHHVRGRGRCCTCSITALKPKYGGEDKHPC